ncbi:MAG: FAD-dependent oxidoreductase [Burkholderiaceae bacterium]
MNTRRDAAPDDDTVIAVDVLVAGAGAAGLAAAIAAHDAGAEVVIAEKFATLQGNSMLSSGSVPGAGTRFQRAAGIDDDARRFSDDLRRQSGPHEADALVDTLARASGPLVEWLADQCGVPIVLTTHYRHVGHSVARLHAPPSRRGAELMAALHAAVQARAIPLAFGNRVEALRADAGGVHGAGLCTRDGRCSRVDAGAVVLATNGFAANRALRERFCPETTDLDYAGAPGSEGEAVLWGEALGATLANMGAYQGHGSYASGHGLLATWTLVEFGGFIVDADGRRFGDESVGYSDFAITAARARAPLHVIYDADIRERTSAGQQEFAELVALGGAREADGPEALASRIGVPAAALADTLASTRRCAQGEAADAFGRRAWARPLAAPLVATRIAPALLHTQGGLAVDEHARVLHRAGGAIAGLYAAGGAAAGISGLRGAHGYVSGNGLLAALALGRIAGAHAAEHARTRGGKATGNSSADLNGATPIGPPTAARLLPSERPS